ncbi:hypothetical protein BKA70DRAFT_1356092 [Coprinopsis sp. MPI-PUGE-AT-0042]|nr:hypothetical protein BKA70DRAFT_1356092 [Coprinopsis sp. MPI-PUGE-AT-0042]
MALRAEGLEEVLSEDEIQRKIVYLAGIWAEALLYGIYLCLFVAAVTVFRQKDGLGPPASKVFFVGNVLIFLIISFHNGLNLATGVLNNLGNWEGFAAPLLLAIVIWIGDALVIYRCFLIWHRSYRVVVVPLLLYFASISTHIANFWWIKNQSTYTRVTSKKWPLLNVPFALYCAQNVLTSTLIIWRIWAQHRRTKKAGIIALNTPSLDEIARIMVESAVVYTAGIIVAMVLRALDHRWGYGTHCILFPTIGIVFMLMALRVYAVQEEARNAPPSASLMPSWLSGEDPKLTRTTAPTTEEEVVPFADEGSENESTRSHQSDAGIHERRRSRFQGGEGDS